MSTVNDGEILQFPQPGTLIAQFRAAFVNMKVDKTGALVLTFRAPPGAKYDAMPVTDFPGTLLDLTIRRAKIMYSEAITAELKACGMVMADDDTDDNDRDEFGADDGA